MFKLLVISKAILAIISASGSLAELTADELRKYARLVISGMKAVAEITPVVLDDKVVNAISKAIEDDATWTWLSSLILRMIDLMDEGKSTDEIIGAAKEYLAASAESYPAAAEFDAVLSA